MTNILEQVGERRGAGGGGCKKVQRLREIQRETPWERRVEIQKAILRIKG